MQIFRSFEAVAEFLRETVVTIGNFDGVHRGHARIVRRARELALPFQRRVLAVTFEPNPLTILAPERAPQMLTTLQEKIALLERAGADSVLVLRSTPELLAQSAEAFLEQILQRCAARAIVEGPNFKFGHARRGSVETLRAAAERGRFEFEVVPAERTADDNVISSTAVRDALRAGQVDLAADKLGRPHRITGVVEHGDGRGAQLGFPTANLGQIPQMIPAEAVYAAVAQTQENEFFAAAVNIGPQPTFGQAVPRVEGHVLDVNRDFVGQELGLHLLARLRAQQKFAGVNELVAQLHHDVRAARAIGAGAVARLRDNIPLDSRR